MKEDLIGISGYRKSLPGGARIAEKGASNGWNPSVSERPGEEQNVDQREQLSGMDEQTSCLAMSTSSKYEQNVGFTGLNNLGNTCFINCVLQSLANIRSLRDYFLNYNFTGDLNEENPLGTGGRLAKAFYTTLKHLWSGQEKAYDPAKLRSIVAKRAPQFLGIMQQDAQEFMAFFLDALHEDLNRVRDKPVFEIQDYDGCPDDEVAQISWKLHRSRNDSFIIDKFHGMYKSRLTCPVCNKESITFDPFLFLPVPLPKPTKSVSVAFFPKQDVTKPLYVDVKVSEEGGMASEVLNFVARTYAVNSANLRMFQAEGGKIVKKLPPSYILPYLASSDSLIVCELSHGELDIGELNHEVVFMQTKEIPNIIDKCTKCGKCSGDSVKIKRCTKCRSVGYCGQACQKSDWAHHKSRCNQRLIGCPLIISLRQSMATYQNISDLLYVNAKHSVKIQSADRIEDITQHDPMKRNINENENAATACANVNDSTAACHKQDRLFNIHACYNDKIAHTVLLEDMENESIDLTGMTHLIVEWKSNLKVTEKPLNSGIRSNKRSNPTLHECIQMFTEPEVLAAEEAWYCPNCRKHREATKELSLWQLPDVLVIQLKRFSFRNRLWRDKIDKLVMFPIKGLDMRPFCINHQSEPPIYDLFGVINHHGGLFGGHYTSYVRLADGNGGDTDLGWRLCDDSHVSAVRSEEEVVTSASYVMFYHRRKKDSSLNINRDIWQNVEHSGTPSNIPSDVSEDNKMELPSFEYQNTNSSVLPTLPKVKKNGSGDNSSLLSNKAESKPPPTHEIHNPTKLKNDAQEAKYHSTMSEKNKKNLANISIKNGGQNQVVETASITTLPYTDMDVMD